MEFIYYILLFFLGASYGSFTSVILYRLKNKVPLKIFSRSSCPECKHTLTPLQLLPLFSYLFLKGKCGFCNKSIPLRYLGLELFLGIVFVIFGLFVDTHYNFTILSLLTAIIAGIFILSSYDFYYKEVEDKITLPFVILLSLILFYQDLVNVNLISLYDLQNILQFSVLSSLLSILTIGLLYYTIFSKYHWAYLITCLLLVGVNFLNFSSSYLFFGSAGAVIFFLFFYIQILVTNGKGVGGGDLRLSIILGLLYGFFTIHGIFATYFLAIFVAIFLIIKNRKITGIELPFAPILFITYFILLCFYR